jgi:hypothetical protein
LGAGEERKEELRIEMLWKGWRVEGRVSQIWRGER